MELSFTDAAKGTVSWELDSGAISRATLLQQLHDEGYDRVDAPRSLDAAVAAHVVRWLHAPVRFPAPLMLQTRHLAELLDPVTLECHTELQRMSLESLMSFNVICDYLEAYDLMRLGVTVHKNRVTL